MLDLVLGFSALRFFPLHRWRTNCLEKPPLYFHLPALAAALTDQPTSAGGEVDLAVR
jgi:hypothetical protein